MICKLFKFSSVLIFIFYSQFINGQSDKAEKFTKLQCDTNYYFIVDTNAKFDNGDINSFRQYISNKVIYFNPDTLSAIGKIVIQFGVDCNGIVNRVKLLRTSNQPIIEESLLTLIKQSPKWTPAIKDKKRVGQLYIYTVNTAHLR